MPRASRPSLAIVLIAFALLGGLSVIVGNQVYHLADNLPRYQETIRAKIRSLRSTTTDGGVIERALGVFQSLSREVSSPKPADGAAVTRRHSNQRADGSSDRTAFRAS